MKKFTLIELMIAVVVLAVILSIVIPNTKGLPEDARATAIASNTRNIQDAFDLYLFSGGDKSQFLGLSLKTPIPVPYDILQPRQLRTLPEDEKSFYWVDDWGVIWGSTIDAPMINFEDDATLRWTSVDGAKEYHIYSVETPSVGSVLMDKKIQNKNLTLLGKTTQTFFDKKEKDKTYLVSAVDRYNLSTAPVGKGYKNYSSRYIKVLRTGTLSSFTDEITYDENNYSGSLVKKGTPYLEENGIKVDPIRKEIMQTKTQTNNQTFSNTLSYDQDGFQGTLDLQEEILSDGPHVSSYGYSWSKTYSSCYTTELWGKMVKSERAKKEYNHHIEKVCQNNGRNGTFYYYERRTTSITYYTATYKGIVTEKQTEDANQLYTQEYEGYLTKRK